MKECRNCLKLKEVFDSAKRNPHGSLDTAYLVMRELHEQKKLTLYMSDCSLENWNEEISMERHFTYNLYMKCRKCKKVYRLGVCIRGKPLYQVLLTEPDKNELKRLCLRDGKIFREEKTGILNTLFGERQIFHHLHHRERILK
ncbi:MAG: hypothetical protein HDQ96_15980 [Lachnospiraceae bacterium]|nr:hypothetical protein [Lachnospiraceae bacterium]